MRKTGDLIGSGFLILLGLGAILGGIQFGVGTPTGPRAGFFPFLSGALLIGLSSILLVQGWRGRSIGTKPFGQLRRPTIVILGMIVYVLIFSSMGYLIASLMLSLIVLRILETRPWWVFIGASIALSAGSYLLFDRVLGVTLPMGILKSLL